MYSVARFLLNLLMISVKFRFPSYSVFVSSHNASLKLILSFFGSSVNFTSQSSYSSNMNDAEVLNTSQSTGLNGGCFLPSLLRVVNGVNNTSF